MTYDLLPFMHACMPACQILHRVQGVAIPSIELHVYFYLVGSNPWLHAINEMHG